MPRLSDRPSGLPDRTPDMLRLSAGKAAPSVIADRPAGGPF